MIRERDACGVGFVADELGRRSRDVLDLVLAGLHGVRHRGATSADGRSGDGAGVLLPLPRHLLPGRWCGLAMVFLRDEAARDAVEAACRAEGIEPAGWRRVPTDPGALGEWAAATRPGIEQLVLLRPTGRPLDEAEGAAYRARCRLAGVPGVYVVSMSFRTVTYKALCAADQLDAFYPDLRDPAYAVSFGIFHQRFSTNTAPSWERAQPFRLLCHNGEINTLAGNVAALDGRAEELGAVLDREGSDSAILDEVAERLVREGRDPRQVVRMLVPRAWQADPSLAPGVRAFYRHHAALVAPWDGPAALVFSDGRVVGAALDRNGLRPLRWLRTQDRLVICASEAGAVPVSPGVAAKRGRLGPGQTLAVDPAGGGLETNGEIERRLARRRPYARWTARRRPLGAGEPVAAEEGALTRRQARAGFTREDLTLVLRAIAQTGHEPLSSMGDDTALPPLAGRARPVSSYLRQRFAQVTNPPIDPLRERAGMSLETLLGARPPLLAEEAEPAGLLELESFFLYPSALRELDAVALDTTFAAGLAAACERLAEGAVAAVREGAPILLLDEGPRGVPIPAVLAVGAVNTALVAAGIRSRTSLVVASDEPRDPHGFAVLLGYGADAICPRLALETIAAAAAADSIGADRPSPAEAQRRFRAAIEEGVLKVLARMGISDVASYRGAALFEAVGLAEDVVDLCLPGTPSVLGGVGFAQLEAEAVARAGAEQLENPGYVKYRKGGEPHANDADTIAAAHALRSAVRGERDELYARFAALVDGRRPLEPRDLLELVPAGEPVPLHEVEPAAAILARFSGGAMSHGSLSAEAHETVALALNRVGGKSNSGEGGESPERTGTDRASAIRQVASARFGVTPGYALGATELQIKISQGSKPGEGGQLPGHKVTAEIAALRHTSAGVQLISPPPHHDIYSIEDLAQLIFDLRQVSPHALISVKLVASAGVGLVAVGVAKALADVIHIAGADGGTGASPLSSIKHAGIPWELGLADAQRELAAAGLRGRVRLRVDGGFKTGRDVLVAAALGADEVSFGTALLIAEGCLLVRSCHLDTCPVGIATQRPELRAKFTATPEMVEWYLRAVADDVRGRLAALGLRSLDEALGRSELLTPRPSPLRVERLLGGPAGGYDGQPVPHAPGGELGGRLARDAAPALEEARIVDLRYAIANHDRAVGARLGGAVGDRTPPGRIRARFEGSAGQSFGAFLAHGVELSLTGEANDGVGKSMGGGRIVVRPPAGDLGDPVLIGNAALYGATGGELYCAGAAGERFAVRNSGARAVVEGAGDHLCEYMTSGEVLVLGRVGRNACAGMTGGVLHVLEAEVDAEHVTVLDPDLAAIQALLERHLRFTGSPRAHALLAKWGRTAAAFSTIVPKAAAVELATPASAE